jgi:hypothetical protein
MGQADSIQAAREAEMRGKAKMSEKLWKQNGPQKMSRSAFVEWKTLTQHSKHDDVLKSALGASGDREAKMK